MQIYSVDKGLRNVIGKNHEISDMKNALLFGVMVAANCGGTVWPYTSLSSATLYNLVNRPITVGGSVLG